VTDRPPPKPPADKLAGRRVRRTASARTKPGKRDAPALSDWAQEIYKAPARRERHEEVDAQVTLSTRLRKPKVHLTAPTTVPRMDLSRYMGRWYEIARLPYFTQRRCTHDVTADYVLGDDGMVHVTNRCAHADGAQGMARGIARVTEPRSNAQLQISFRTLYGVHVLWDHYWVIGLGDNYEYALVGQPSRRRGWVLAREPQPTEDQIQRWLDEFQAKGFPAQAFERTRQSGEV
jgi:apolipoprotein D and lipocalin family protein